MPFFIEVRLSLSTFFNRRRDADDHRGSADLEGGPDLLQDKLSPDLRNEMTQALGLFAGRLATLARVRRSADEFGRP